MILLLIAVAMLVSDVTLLRTELEGQWQQYKLGFNKSYKDTEEEERRRLNWEENFDLVVKHNKEADRGVHTYWIGINKFSDLSEEEFNEIYTMHYPDYLEESRAENDSFDPPGNFSIPDEVNWVEKNVVNRVKDQGDCKAGYWAFSAVATVESMIAIKTGKLVSLSDQHMIDCIPAGNCKGGKELYVYNYIIKNGGINTEESYPYEGKMGECRFKPDAIGATIKEWSWAKNSEDAIQRIVASVGPVTTALECCTREFYQYKKGIYDDDRCKHAHGYQTMAIVGYGSGRVGAGDWWLMKNSFGVDWGDKGYVYMRRNKNMCKLKRWPLYPVA